MSSHHFVKENQEPALIIANGESCSMDLLNQLLGWSPLVIVLDGAIERVMDLGIKVDILLGDFDREFDPEKYLKLQYPLKIVHTPDQEHTDLDKAYHYLIQNNIKAANVVWATGRRADHAITNMTNIVRYREKLKIVIFDDYSKIFLLPYKFEKWYPEGFKLSLIPVGNVEEISTENLSYPLVKENLVLGYRTGSSNQVLKDGIVEITYKKGDLLMMECKD
ncbi:MAG TPA: thiamine diphosphokinase [Edaphocola sp.]|nr:thiamine diphosphokinase [Edaphocola sp.]